MFSRYLHRIDPSGLHSYLDTKRELKRLASFPDDAEGTAQFSSWLEHARLGTHTLLVDLPDESFQHDSIPFVTGSDRKMLLARKQDQLFAGAPFSSAISLGREKTGRHDERVLFAAITRPAALEPWLLVLRAHNAPLAAIYSIPLLTPQLVSQLPADAAHAPHGLVVSFSPSGIRQTYFENAKLRFSRLCPAPEGDYANWGDACLRETRKTLQYLTTQRWIPRHQRLPVWLLLARHDFTPILKHLDQTEPLDFRPVCLENLISRFKYRPDPISSDSHALLMPLALQARRGPQFAPPRERQIFRLRQLGLSVLSGGLAIAGVLLGMALHTHSTSRELWQQRDQLQMQSRQEEVRYQQLLASLPPLPTSLESLRSVIDGVDQLDVRRAEPDKALEVISHTLDHFPDISVISLDWQLSTANPGTTTTTLVAALPLTTAADPRASLQHIRAFAAELNGQNAETNLLDLPFDASSDKTLRSTAQTLDKRPEFKLRLLLNQGPQS